LAAAFPPEAHALPIAGTSPLRIRSADSLVRDLWDALADTLVRSPAAATTGADALSVLNELCTPSPEMMEEARMLGAVRVRGNRATLAGGRFQLRLSRSGLWYGFEKATRTWIWTKGPASDPRELALNS
jgi:hypothetical protein